MKLRAEELKQQSKDMNEHRISIEKEKKEILDQLFNLKDSQSSAISKYDTINEELQSKKTELRNTKEELQKLRASYDEIKNEKRILELEIKHSNTKSEEEIAALQQQIQLLDSTIATQTESRHRRDKEIENLKNEETKLKEKKKYLEETNEKLNEQLSELNTLKQESMRYSMENEALERQNKDILERVDELKDVIQKSDKKNNALTEEIDDWRKRTEVSEHKVFGANNKIEILKVQKSQLERERQTYEKMESDFHEKTKEVITLKTHLESAKKSM